MVRLSDLEISSADVWPKGGQQVSRTYHAVKVLHIPTGIYSMCGSEKSQHKNKAIAMGAWLNTDL